MDRSIGLNDWIQCSNWINKISLIGRRNNFVFDFPLLLTKCLVILEKPTNQFGPPHCNYNEEIGQTWDFVITSDAKDGQMGYPWKDLVKCSSDVLTLGPSSQKLWSFLIFGHWNFNVKLQTDLWVYNAENRFVCFSNINTLIVKREGKQKKMGLPIV